MVVRVIDQNTQFMLTNWFHYMRVNKKKRNTECKDIIMKIINKTCYYTITTNLFNTYIDKDIMDARILPLDTGNDKLSESVVYF